MKKFQMKDEEFTCIVCGKKVPKANYTARDHCPYCLSSLHVDIMPGDRMNPCKGVLKPVGIEKFRDTYKIIYRCEKCHELNPLTYKASSTKKLLFLWQLNLLV